MLRPEMAGSNDNGAGTNGDRESQRVRTIIVAGQSSDRTREVLRALSGFTNVIWPTSLESALALRPTAAAVRASPDTINDLRNSDCIKFSNQFSKNTSAPAERSG